MSNPMFKLSADARFLAQELRNVAVGASISYATLAAALGSPVTGATSALHSARRVLLREDNIVFTCERGVGLKRLTDGEIVKESETDVNAIRRRAHKGVRKLAAVQDFGALSNKEQLDHTVRMAVFTISAEAASGSGERKLSAQIGTQTASQLPLSKIAEAFLPKKDNAA